VADSWPGSTAELWQLNDLRNYGNFTIFPFCGTIIIAELWLPPNIFCIKWLFDGQCCFRKGPLCLEKKLLRKESLMKAFLCVWCQNIDTFCDFEQLADKNPSNWARLIFSKEQFVPELFFFWAALLFSFRLLFSPICLLRLTCWKALRRQVLELILVFFCCPIVWILWLIPSSSSLLTQYQLARRLRV
jgi:hypothetical protein